MPPIRPQHADPTAPAASAPAPRQAYTIAGIRVDNLTEGETADYVEQLIQSGGQYKMVVVNAAKIVAAGHDKKLRQILDGADIVTADGMSVVWASRLLGQPLKERVTGIDLFERLVGRAARRGFRVYFLGAREEVVWALTERFRVQFPDLCVAGYRNGYFAQSESGAVADAIRESRADLLFVAMGSPAQEYWMAAWCRQTGARFTLGVGGSFDHVSGFARRAPRWMQRAGLEWLYRLAREPRRLWRRYLVGNSAFLWLVLKQLVSPDRRLSKGSEKQ